MSSIAGTVAVHSFHSQSINPIHAEAAEPVLSFDGHLDTRMITQNLVDAVLELASEDVLRAFERPKTHFLLGRAFQTYVVTPEDCLGSERNFTKNMLGEVRDDVPGAEIDSGYVLDLVSRLRENLGMEVQYVPRERLESADLSSIRVVDVDVDYLEEFQEDCFTSLEGCSGGTVDDVIETVKEAEPNLVTVAEARNVDDLEPLLEELRDLNYQVERGRTFSEERADKLLTVHREFERFFNEEYLTPEDPFENQGDLKGDAFRQWAEANPEVLEAAEEPSGLI